MTTRRLARSNFRIAALTAAVAVLATFAVAPATAGPGTGHPTPTPSVQPTPGHSAGRHPQKSKPASPQRTPKHTRQPSSGPQTPLGASARLRAADRRVVRKAPRGMAAFVQWLGVVDRQGTAARAPSRARVVADVAALNRLAPRAVKDLSRMPDARAQRLVLAVARSSIAPSLRHAGPAFTGEPGFYFYTSLQYWLEEMGTVSGARGALTLLPMTPPKGRVLSLAAYHREVVVDQDQDGRADAFDPDIDGDGIPNQTDPANNLLGISDVFLVRVPFTTVAAATKAGAPRWPSCFFAREAIPRFGSIAAASRFRTSRRCRPLGSGVSSVPGNAGQPTVTGTATVGSTLTANPGTWTGSPPPTLSYLWRYQDSGGDWRAISGATSSTYTLRSSDLGHTVRVDVTGTNHAGSAAQASPEVGPVTAGGSSAPEMVSAPSVSGTAAVGSLLTADPGSWTDSPTSYTYQWQRGGSGSWSAISGATAQSYIPATADVGAQLRVQVTANNADGQGSATSPATSAVPSPAAAPVNTAMPAVTGTAQANQTLTASPGSWTGSPTLGYAWQRSTVTGVWTAIPGATGSTYNLTSADVGAVLRVQVTGTNGAGSSVAQSAQTSTVVATGGCTVSPTTDTDGDGVPDCEEIAGFTVTIATTGTGTTTNRKVTSDPTKPDTDGDQIPDGSEWHGAISDPGSADTDGDGLSDYQELIVYKSLPSNVDSDGDALVPNSDPRSADPRLLDGTEVNGYPFAGETIATSPVLADTDGDSLTDYTEISSGGYNPLVADLPKLQVTVPSNVSTDIQVFTTRTDTNEQVNYSGSLNESTDTSTTHTVNLTNVQTTNKQSDTLNAGVKAGYAKGKPYVEGNIDNSHTWEKGTVTDTQTGFTQDTTKSTQQQYQKYTQDTASHSVTTAPTGTLSTAVVLHNPGKISYTATDLVVTAFQQDPVTPGSIEPIATLQLPAAVQSGITLAPGDTKGPYQVSATDVSSDKLLGLLGDPGSLIYTVVSPNLTNPTTQESYAEVGQNVNAQTATVSIDDGTNNPVTYLVATNVLRDSQGAAAGADLKTVMSTILKQPYQTCAQNTGTKVLCGVGSVSTTDVQHAWSVLASDDVTLGGDFDSLVLHAGSLIQLTYLVDSDGDGLLDPQENLYGTSPTDTDTDNDGLTDYGEVRSGWTVPKIGPQPAYQAYSNPLTNDIDGDGSYDACPGQAVTCGTSGYRPESARLTDPNNPDTNSDGVWDGQQADSAVLAYCPGCYRVPIFDSAFGSAGDGDGQFNTPGPVAVDRKNGFVYVGDVNNDRIEKFDLSGTFILAFGSSGSGDGQFQDLAFLAVDGAGNIYTTDDQSYAVQKFAPNGSFIQQTNVGVPAGITVDSSGYVYVINTNQQIYKFNANFGQVAVLDVSAANFTNAAGLAVDSKGNLYVSNIESGNTGVVVKFDPTGNLIDSWPGSGTTFTTPANLAVDSHDYLYVSDYTTNTIAKLDSDGNVLASWGRTGTGSGLFKLALGIGVDGSCSVYLADADNNRVQKFSYPTGCN